MDSGPMPAQSAGGGDLRSRLMDMMAQRMQTHGFPQGLRARTSFPPFQMPPFRLPPEILQRLQQFQQLHQQAVAHGADASHGVGYTLGGSDAGHLSMPGQVHPESSPVLSSATPPAVPNSPFANGFGSATVAPNGMQSDFSGHIDAIKQALMNRIQQAGMPQQGIGGATAGFGQPQMMGGFGVGGGGSMPRGAY